MINLIQIFIIVTLIVLTFAVLSLLDKVEDLKADYVCLIQSQIEQVSKTRHLEENLLSLAYEVHENNVPVKRNKQGGNGNVN